jgi:hypothetical protein
MWVGIVCGFGGDFRLDIILLAVLEELTFGTPSGRCGWSGHEVG